MAKLSSALVAAPDPFFFLAEGGNALSVKALDVLGHSQLGCKHFVAQLAFVPESLDAMLVHEVTQHSDFGDENATAFLTPEVEGFLVGLNHRVEDLFAHFVGLPEKQKQRINILAFWLQVLLGQNEWLIYGHATGSGF